VNGIAIAIEKMAFGGAGFGHLNGKACFVPFTAPGDVVKIRVVKEKSSYLEGEVTELVQASKYRIQPPCPVFGSCGGCDWQHLDYLAQLNQKELIFRDILWRVARVSPDRILPIIPSPQAYGYRSRVQFKLRWVDGTLKFGFYRRGSHYVIDLPGSCLVANAACNALIASLRHVLTHSPEPDRIPQVDLATGDDGSSIVIIHYAGENRRSMREYLHLAQDRLPRVGGLFLQTGRKESLVHLWGVTHLNYQVPGSETDLTMTFGAGSFAQVNYGQNRQLIELVRNWSALEGVDSVLDLYCGNGNFTLPLAQRAGSVCGYESYPPAIVDAQRNVALNGIGNACFAAEESTSCVQRLADQPQLFDVVVIDPPRTGAHDIARLLPKLAKRSLLYISCDPTTLARDLSSLTKEGLNLVCCQPFDMFPQTYHMESVALLSPHHEPRSR
jgi:23S rRNA (uracil1939-C5)-methyltransferase